MIVQMTEYCLVIPMSLTPTDGVGHLKRSYNQFNIIAFSLSSGVALEELNIQEALFFKLHSTFSFFPWENKGTQT